MSYPVPAGIADVTVITSYDGREVMEMANEAWRTEKRDEHGEWTGEGRRAAQLAAMDPGQRALALAQETARMLNPKLTAPLGTGQNADEILRAWLREAGHPKADDAYVVRHTDPRRGTSNTARGPDGEPAVALHTARWDYGTLAHETAHLIRDQETGRQVNGPPPPGGVHGPEYVEHYAKLLNKISPGAGNDLRAGYRTRLAREASA